jgi:hypothetical protein
MHMSLVEKSKRKSPLGKPRHILENIQIYLKYIKFDEVDRIHQAQNKDFFLQWLFQPILQPLIQFRTHSSQTVGPLGRVISPTQGRYLHTGQHKKKLRGF